MSIDRLCKDCKTPITVWSRLQTRCMACTKKRSKAKPPKPIRKIGRRTIEYNKWRDSTAKPYLIKMYGYVCSVYGCYEDEDLHVDHIKTRGAHPELKHSLSNVRFLCFEHHRMITDGATLNMKFKELEV